MAGRRIGGQKYMPDALRKEIEKVSPRKVSRIQGKDRYAVANAITKQIGEQETVILVSGEVHTDALVIAPVVKSQNLPLFLTKAKGMSRETEGLLRRRDAENLTLVGGTNTLPENVWHHAALTYITKDGSYEGGLRSSANGQPTYNYGSLRWSTIDAKENVLLVNGTVNYNLELFQDGADSLLPDGTRAFRLTDKTIYQAIGGTAPPAKFTQDKFNKYLYEVRNTGLGLIIEVNNGYVTHVSISS